MTDDSSERVTFQEYQAGGGLRVRQNGLQDDYVLIEEYDGDGEVANQIVLHYDETRPLVEALDKVMNP